ncbi:hypothetical protein C8Q80DRAFT_1136298 [Daedaleopsis nitida]|nr:hypothetical protein C8Q80DRAFT_1136298 [Daedaleopsis nitida]
MKPPSSPRHPNGVSEAVPDGSMERKSVFPTEIYERIIELLHEDFWWSGYTTQRCRSDLLHCSLVCRAWRPKARALVFRFLLFGSEADHNPYPRYFDGFRRYLEEAPHLASLVEEVQIVQCADTKYPYRSLIEIFPSSLGIHLPRLVSVVLTVSHRRMSIHPRFFFTPARVETVTTLELHMIPIMQLWDLDCLLLPYPNIRTLILQTLQWKKDPMIGSNRTVRVPQRLSEIRILDTLYNVIPQKSSRPYYESGIRLVLNAYATSVNKMVLNIATIGLLSRLKVEESDRRYEISEMVTMPHLKTLVLELFEMLPRHDLYDLIDRYAVTISNASASLYHLHCQNLEKIEIHFSRRNLLESAGEVFLRDLASVRSSLEGIVQTSHFPRLREFAMYASPIKDIAPSREWKEAIENCFPLLKGKGMITIHSHVHLREHYGYYCRRDMLA